MVVVTITGKRPIQYPRIISSPKASASDGWATKLKHLIPSKDILFDSKWLIHKDIDRDNCKRAQ